MIAEEYSISFKHEVDLLVMNSLIYRDIFLIVILEQTRWEKI